MALPASGLITMADLQEEFETSANQLNQYYRGGGVVPAGAAFAAIPYSGQIALSNFHGVAYRPGGGGPGGGEGDPYL